MKFHGRLIGLGNNDSEAVLVDITRPDAPSVASQTPITVDAEGIEFQDDVLFVSYFSTTGTLEAYDISDPTAPSLLDSVPDVGFLSQLYARGDYLFASSFNFGVAETPNQFKIFNVSDPSNLNTSIAGVDTGNGNIARNMDVTENVAAFVGNDMFVTVDISNPTEPSILSHETGNDPWDVTLMGVQAWGTPQAGTGTTSIWSWDITNPADPILALDTAFGQPTAVASQRDVVYVLDDSTPAIAAVG